MTANENFEPLTNSDLISYLRNALHYLYDPVHLRRNTLVKLLGLSREFDPADALQQLLMNAIQDLKPTDDEMPLSTAWRIYDTLNLQYIRQYSREMVATQLGVSERQLRREQRLALEALAQYFMRKHPILVEAGVELVESMAEEAAETVEGAGDQARRSLDEAFQTELGWLRDPAFEQRSPLEGVLETVVELAQPLAQQWRVPLQIQIEPGQQEFPVAQMVIRNILLTILSVAIPRSPQGPVSITATRQGVMVEIQVNCCDTSQSEPFSEKENTSIDTAQRLATLYGAQLTIRLVSTGLSIILALPAPEQIPVLVIDDNADWLDLIKRYAAGSRYHVIGLREPELARVTAEKFQPAVILVDVMMPNVDGWQIISELRNERSTSHIPIIICSILPLEDLALSLGVNAFLQKPITQGQFINALDQQLGVVG